MSLHKSALHRKQPGLYVFAPQSYKSYSVGPDSYPNSDGLDWSNVTVVVDEFSGIRKEILTHSGSVVEFERMMAECQHLIVADAFMSQVDYSIINAYRDAAELVMVQDAPKAPDKIHLVETRTKDGKISMTNDGAALALVDQWLIEGVERFAIVADNLLQLKIIREHLTQTYPHLNTCVTCSETPEANRQVLSKPDETFVLWRIDVAMLTPTAQSGVDIQTPFDRGLVIASGVIAPTQIVQMMKRFRRCRDWWVIAPRKTADHSLSFRPWQMSIDKLTAYTLKGLEAFDALDVASAVYAREQWAAWEEIMGQIEQSFNREYLEHLYREFFESVDVVEVDGGGHRQQAEQYRDIVKQNDCDRALTADLNNGERLMADQKNASTDQEVWDLKLAHLYALYPRTTGQMIANCQTEGRGDSATFRIYSGSRISKLKYWLIAEEEHGFCDELIKTMQARQVNTRSNNYRAYRAIRAYRLLKLGDLAQVVKKQKGAIAGITHYSVFSDRVQALWAEFKRQGLNALYPTVETVSDCWAELKKVMSFMGFEKDSGNARVGTSALHANGYDRNGNARQSRSKVVCHTGFMRMECSGNCLFQSLFDEICGDIRDLIQRTKPKPAADNTQSPQEWVPDPEWAAA